METRTNTGYVAFLSVVAAIGGILFGYDTTVISGTITSVETQFALNAMQVGWYVGCALIGSIGGVAVAGILSDRFGRKLTMLLAAVLFTASGIGCAVCGDFTQLVIYRILGGIGIGVVSIVSPMYISEVAVARWRGTLVSLYQLAITIGFLGAYLVNFQILRAAETAIYDSPWMQQIMVTEMWRGMLGSNALPAVLFFVVIFFIPESPRWLVTNRCDDKAFRVLSRISGPETARAELDEIRYSVGHGVEGTFRELFRGKMFKLLLIGIMLSVFQQVTGINVMMYYAPDVFKSTGMGNDSAIYYTMIMGMVNLIFVTVSILFVDKVGRRKLMIFGPAGMGFFMFCISVAYFTGNFTGMLPLLLMMGYLAFFALSLGPIVWVLLGEIFPNRIRSRAVSVSILAMWAANFLVSFTFPILKESLGSGFTFLIYGVMCVACVVFVCRCIVETKGKTLEQIEKEFLG